MVSEETRERMRIAAKARIAKNGIWNKGKKMSESYCLAMRQRMELFMEDEEKYKPWVQKQSESHMGHISCRKGVKLSDETKEKMQIAARKRCQSPIYLEKQRASHLDQVGYWTGKERPEFSKEQREKMRISHLGKKFTTEHKLKISQNSTGVPKPTLQGRKLPMEVIMKLKAKRALQILPLQNTKIEIKVQSMLQELGIAFSTHKYIDDIKHKYQCDIFIDEQKIVIECDGDYWHCNPKIYSSNVLRASNDRKLTAQQVWNLDRIRTEEMVAIGYKVIRLWESEIKTMTSSELNEKIKKI